MNQAFEPAIGRLQPRSRLPKDSRVVFVSTKASIAKKQGYGRTQKNADKSQGFYPWIALAPCLPYPAALLINSFYLIARSKAGDPMKSAPRSRDRNFALARKPTEPYLHLSTEAPET